MTRTIRLTGNMTEVVQKVAKLPETVYLSALIELKELIMLFVGLAQVYCPVDTGSLRDSIRMQWIGEGRRIARVTAGGYVVNPKSGNIVDYAAIVESRQPYMRPAWEEARVGVEDLIHSRVVEAVE